MDAGEPWLTTSGGASPTDMGSPDVILMGDDLAARELSILTGLQMISDATYSPQFDRYVRRLVISTKIFGGDQQNKLELVLSTEDAKRLQEMLVRWLGT